MLILSRLKSVPKSTDGKPPSTLMKRTFRRLIPCLLTLAVSFAASLAFGAGNILFGPTGTEASVSNPDGTWIHMWDGISGQWNTIFDTTNPPPTGDVQGSVYNQGDWTGDTSGGDLYRMVSPGTYYRAVVFDGSQYSSIEFDLKFDTNSTMTPNSNRHMAYGFDDGTNGYSFCQMGDVSFESNSPYADGNWHHVSIPVTLAAFTSSGHDPTQCDGVSYYRWNPGGTTGTFNFWMANVVAVASIVTNPPPTISMTKPAAGLHFVQGSISGQYDRQNIITANGANGSASYSWANTATAGSPVTYSFNISQFAGPDLNYHIFIYPETSDGASAPDYNQANVLDLQITPSTNAPQAIGQLLWKTNLPSASTTNVALAFTNSTLLGTWQLQFTGNTSGQVLAPGGNSYPFTVDPSIPVALANPVIVNFGINPSIDSNSIVGEEVVVSQVGISGASPLSTNYSTSDNFLTDSSLDPATWTVNALDPASIWFIPGDNAFSINWNIPDSGFSLIESSNLLSLGDGTSVGSTPVQLIPGKRSLITKSALLPGQGFFALIKRAPYQLQVLMPGETNAPNTSTGKIGTPVAQSVSGSGTLVTINMCDAKWNIVNSIDTVHLTSSDGTALLPASDGSLVSGTLQETVIFQTQPATSTVTASDVSNTNILSNTSSPVTVGP